MVNLTPFRVHITFELQSQSLKEFTCKSAFDHLDIYPKWPSLLFSKFVLKHEKMEMELEREQKKIM